MSAIGITVVENGKTFIDITDQFTFNEEEPKRNIEISPTTTVNQVNPVVPKKRVKTFKEIFADFIKFFIPVKADSGKDKIQKIAMDMSIILIVCCIIGIVGVFVEKQESSLVSNGQIATVDKLSDNKYVEAWKEAYAQSSGTNFPTGMNSKYAYLLGFARAIYEKE